MALYTTKGHNDRNTPRIRQGNDQQQASSNPSGELRFKKNTPFNNRFISNQTHRDKAQSPVICRNFPRGFNCFHGRNCPYRQTPRAQVNVVAAEEIPSAQINDLDFPYGPGEKWWLAYRSDTVTITYLTFCNTPHNNPRSSELISPSRGPPSSTPQW